MILLIPLLYSVLLFREKLFIKIVICSIFTLLILSLENLVIISLRPLMDASASGNLTHLAGFFFQRIGCKVILYFIIHRLLLWPGNSRFSFPPPAGPFCFWSQWETPLC